MPSGHIDIDVLEGRIAVARLDPGAAVPAWAYGEPLTSITRTAAELSIVCPANRVPAGVRQESDFRALAVRGPLDFDAVGVLRALAEPLAAAGIPILAISTFDTDYVLVREADLTPAEQALERAGHRLAKSRRAAIG